MKRSYRKAQYRTPEMERRRFIKGAIAGGVVAAGSIGWMSIDEYEPPLNIDYLLKHLKVMLQREPSTTGDWNLAQILIHCAQSVEYSMEGFPENKPAVFQYTVGQAVFAAFARKRKMTHSLNEPIPGAPALPVDADVNYALARFIHSLEQFLHYGGPLKPHFAYGPLTKQEYQAAHVMHFNNHMKEIVFAKSLV